MTRTVLDLGNQPLANAYMDPDRGPSEESHYPLHARVCDVCLLMQVEDVVPPESIFTDYAYFSSYSDSWLDHARMFAQEVAERFSLASPSSLVVEVASNDGYLLKHFRDLGVRVLGIEPARNVAEAARASGVPTKVAFFGKEFAGQLSASGVRADLLVANNVLAHVPDLNGFVAGLETILAPSGVVSVEVPHLLRLLQNAQFDTIYHEHFSYFSLLVLEHVFSFHGLRIFDVEELDTHGGSLRVFAVRSRDEVPSSPRVDHVRAAELAAGLGEPHTYEMLGARAVRSRGAIQEFLSQAHRSGDVVAAYGAAAKGNTLLNYCRIDVRDVPFVADRSPHKQGLLMPGSRIPIVSPDHISRTQPDYLWILPWNLEREIVESMSHIRHWSGRFLVAVPDVRIIS